MWWGASLSQLSIYFLKGLLVSRDPGPPTVEGDARLLEPLDLFAVVPVAHHVVALRRDLRPVDAWPARSHAVLRLPDDVAGPQ